MGNWNTTSQHQSEPEPEKHSQHQPDRRPDWQPEPEDVIQTLFKLATPEGHHERLRSLSEELEIISRDSEYRLSVLTGLSQVALSEASSTMRMTALAKLGKIDEQAAVFVACLMASDPRDELLQQKALRKISIDYQPYAKSIVPMVLLNPATDQSVRVSAVHLLRARDPKKLDLLLEWLPRKIDIAPEDIEELKQTGRSVTSEPWISELPDKELFKSIYCGIQIIRGEVEPELVKKELGDLEKDDPLSAYLLCSALAANDSSVGYEEASKILLERAPEVLYYLNYRIFQNASLTPYDSFLVEQYPVSKDIIDQITEVLKEHDETFDDYDTPSNRLELSRYYKADLKSIHFNNVHAVDMERPYDDYRELLSSLPQEISIRPKLLNKSDIPNMLFSIIPDEYAEIAPLEKANEESLLSAYRAIESLIDEGMIVPDALNAENWVFAPGKGESGQLYLMNWRSYREIDLSRDNVQEFIGKLKKVLMPVDSSEDSYGSK